MNEGKVKIYYDRYATSTPFFQLINPTFKVSTATTKVPNIGRGFARITTTRIKLVPADRPSYLRTEGGSE
jgi:hypothetical protein